MPFITISQGEYKRYLHQSKLMMGRSSKRNLSLSIVEKHLQGCICKKKKSPCQSLVARTLLRFCTTNELDYMQVCLLQVIF